MEENPHKLGAILLPIGIIACCGLPLLVASAATGALGGWLVDGGVMTAGGGALLLAGAYYLWRTAKRRARGRLSGKMRRDASR